MAQILVRNLDEATKLALQKRAAIRGTSMEAEAREILQHATQRPPTSKIGLGTRIHARFARIGGVELELPPSATATPAELPE